MKFNRPVLFGLLSAVSIVAFTACHPRNTLRSHFGGDTEEMPRRIDYVVGRMTRTLDLDEVQQERLRTMAEAVHARMAEIRTDRETVKSELIGLVSKGSVDAREIDDFMRRKMERIEPVRLLVAENLAAFHAMLRPEQREKLVAEIRNHEPGRCRFARPW